MGEPFDFDQADDEFVLNVDADMNPLYVGSYVHVFDEDVYGTIVAAGEGDSLLIILDGDITEETYLLISDEVRITDR